ncbi:MAG: hypothetical protein AAB263_21990 [Planctomycetota bacterium]
MPRIGWASRDITPQRPAVIPGQMYVRIGREAADPLTLTALALDGGTPNGRAVFVSCDLTNFTEELQNDVSAEVWKRVPELSGCPVVLNATHTHDGFMTIPGKYAHPGGDVMTAKEGHDWLVANAATAAVDAWGQRRSRHIGRAFAHAVVGHNRRAVYANGLARMYGKTDDPAFRHIEGFADHSLDMIFIWEDDGSISGVVIDIPCPSQVEEHLETFSADFWHDIRLELRKRLGQHLVVLPLCGAAGDQSPHPLLYGRQEAEMRARSGLSERQEIAQRVADAVTRALACTKPMTGAVPVACTTIRPVLPGRRVTRSERDWAAVKRAEFLVQRSDPDQWWPQRLQEVVDAYDRDQPMPQAQPTLHIVRLGDAVIATNPFELYIDYAMQIKARSPTGQTLLVQLAGGSAGYLACARSMQTGDYGSHPASSPIGSEGGQVLVEATLAAIAGLFPNQQQAAQSA